MLLGAALALLSHDLKAILAYSTVSQLGFLIGYYGLGKAGGVAYDYLHILNHVFYKGCLFMVAGIVAHASGIRDIRQLGGLLRRLPWTGAAALIATAAMAGLPGTIGFVSKEMVLKEVFDATGTHGWTGWHAAVCVVTASLVQVAFAARLFAHVFLGREPDAVARQFHAPSFGMQLPPLILAALALLFGLFPGWLIHPLQQLSVAGLNTPGELSLWHGVNLPLIASVIIVAFGLALYGFSRRLRWPYAIPPWLQFDVLFESGMERFSKFTRQITRFLRSDQPVDYLPIIFGFTVAAAGGMLVWKVGGEIQTLLNPAGWPAIDPLRAFVAGLIALAIFGVVVLKRWTTQLISLSVAGFLVCFYFVLYRAPDLALTQILVEVVTLFMILILLGRFPRSAEVGEVTHKHPPWRNGLNLIIALCVGGMMTGFILVVTHAPHPDRIGPLFLDQTVPLAQGTNPVNTILVDFRGFDTLGEITVLIVAVLGGLGLLMRYRRTAAEYKAGPMGPPGFGIGSENDPEKWR
jgi:multisubunit Na+/H+ antiporter MnhB subunit